VPFAVLTCWLVGTGRRVAWRSPAAWLCLGTSAVVGVSNPYNLFFFLQLLTLALVAQFFGERRRANLQLGAACMAAAFGTFFLLQADMWLYASNEGALPVLTRNYGGTELYALKPIELFLAPSSHHLGVLADVAYRYLRWSELSELPDWRGCSWK
jgi:hypothetical protein